MSFRDDNLAAIEAVQFPPEWSMGDPDSYFRYERTWWRDKGRDAAGQRRLAMVKLSAQGGRNVIEVSGFAMTILCGADRIQAAVNVVLAWERPEGVDSPATPK